MLLFWSHLEGDLSLLTWSGFTSHPYMRDSSPCPVGEFSVSVWLTPGRNVYFRELNHSNQDFIISLYQEQLHLFSCTGPLQPQPVSSTFPLTIPAMSRPKILADFGCRKSFSPVCSCADKEPHQKSQEVRWRPSIWSMGSALTWWLLLKTLAWANRAASL